MSYINKLMESNFIEYASYVIKDRAIPDINDGLKPVQRRILHSLYEIDDGKFNKVANVVGNTMKYHPHGDASIFSSLVTLANKELFLDTQGNFGNILTGDDASAARYIECRLSPLAKEVLFNPEITSFFDTYDGRNKEPYTLPAKVPVLLLMGAEGIAVGMSTKILPHNFNELLSAQIKILNNESFTLYPDFQQGGVIDVTEYNKGNGRIKNRAVIEVTDTKTLVIKELPFGVTTESLIDSIQQAVKKGTLKVSSINDFTADKVEIEITLMRGENASDILDALYAYTDCEVSTSVNLITIVDFKPRELNIEEVLKYNTEKLVKDLQRELEIELEKLRQKLHDLTLEQIFIENRIYKKIEELTTYESIIKTVTDEMNKFKALFIRELTGDDVEKLLQIRIKRISLFDILNHKKQIDDIVRTEKTVLTKLKNMKKTTIDYIAGLIEKYGKNYPRKTKIKTINKIDIKEVAVPDIKVYFDEQSGYFGKDIKSSKYFTVNPHEKFIVFNKGGSFRVVPIEGKIFVDIDVVYIDQFDPERVYSVIYTEAKTKLSFVKKFKVTKFIANKLYPLCPGGKAEINYFTINPNEKVIINYIKKPKQKLNKEEFTFKEIEIKGASVKGNRVSTKEIDSILKK